MAALAAALAIYSGLQSETANPAHARSLDNVAANSVNISDRERNFLKRALALEAGPYNPALREDGFTAEEYDDSFVTSTALLANVAANRVQDNWYGGSWARNLAARNQFSIFGEKSNLPMLFRAFPTRSIEDLTNEELIAMANTDPVDELYLSAYKAQKGFGQMNTGERAAQESLLARRMALIERGLEGYLSGEFGQLLPQEIKLYKNKKGTKEIWDGKKWPNGQTSRYATEDPFPIPERNRHQYFSLR